ncbi:MULTISPECIES: hypothetical protein [Catenuloplanes]|uniref:Uncharacterized protein n=1 Tax=Catenuloplanes niger TaxID=587534 RepID=A0AAE3ZMM8_9ACTN|nr:hypothetical protein [Catenuloplanes niger]MDR7320655.1 hypothetical protein [Catenuloplanes niger]
MSSVVPAGTDLPEGVEEGFVGSFCAFNVHGLLIFRDVQSRAVHDGHSGNDTVHAASDSVYVAVQPSVVGPVLVDVYEDGDPDVAIEGPVLYDGDISSAYGQFVLHDSPEDVRLAVTTDVGGVARLRISADRRDSPSEVRFQIWYRP